MPTILLLIYDKLAPKLSNAIQKPKMLKADMLAPILVPLIFLVLVVVTSIIIVAWQTSVPILNQSFNHFNVPGNYRNITYGLGNNLYAFNFYLPLIFYFMMLAILISTVMLNANAIAWLIGIVYLPLIYYVTIWISNIAHGILGLSVLAPGVSHLPLSVVIFANLPTISLMFAGAYIVLICVRVLFFNQAGAGVKAQGSRGMGYQ